MGLGATSLRRLIADGEIPVLKVRGKTQLLEADIEAYLQGRYGRVYPVPYNDSRPGVPEHILDSDLWTKV